MTPERFRKIKTVLQHRQPDLTVVMDDVHKPRNLAAIARSCEAVGIPELHGISPQKSIRLTQKAASGCGDWLSIRTHASVSKAYAHLRSQGLRILAAHFREGARDFREIDYTQPTALVVGAELEGISQEAAEQADGAVIVPMMGMTQSLNVSVATALILFEAQRQRQAAGMYDERRMDDDTFERLLFEWSHPQVAKYCRRKGFPYPKIDEAGDIVEALADRVKLGLVEG